MYLFILMMKGEILRVEGQIETLQYGVFSWRVVYSLRFR